MDDFQQLSQRLRDGELKLHWTGYTGYGKNRQDILDALHPLLKYLSLAKFNVINYNYSALKLRKDVSVDLLHKMLYTKFPERILYGLLRGSSKDFTLEADIYIEYSQEYADLQLAEEIFTHLNVQSLYRSQSYSVVQTQLMSKGREIGLELTDMLLGILRHVMRQREDSKSYQAKSSLVNELLLHKPFFDFLSSIHYYEWNNERDLQEVEFREYLCLYVARQPGAFF